MKSAQQAEVPQTHADSQESRGRAWGGGMGVTQQGRGSEKIKEEFMRLPKLVEVKFWLSPTVGRIHLRERKRCFAAAFGN